MNRRFFVIGDIEMGKGDIMDDFHDDDPLVRFVEHAGRAHADEVTLILNGDVFDFLKMDFQGKYPRYITEEISLWKLERVLEVHPKVFAALAEFLKIPHGRLVFVIGNHDADVAWPGVQARLREALTHDAGGSARDPKKITFTHAFDEKHFHVQHGNLIDPFFGFDHEQPIIRHNGQEILNLPIGSHLVTQYLIPLKTKFHDKEVMYPQHEVFKKYPEYQKEIRRLTGRHAFGIFLVDPVVKRGDPMYRVPYRRMVKHLLKHGFDGVHDDRFLDIEELDSRFGKKQLYVLSHAHVLKDKHHRGSRYLFVDCWRTELNVLTPDLQKKPKTYVEIALEGDKLAQAELKVFAT